MKKAEREFTGAEYPNELAGIAIILVFAFLFFGSIWFWGFNCGKKHAERELVRHETPAIP